METNIETKSSQQFSTDQFIGGLVKERKEAAGFEGDIKRDSDLVEELLPGPANISLHEQGIKIRNTYYEREFAIHFPQLIELDRIEKTESYQPEKSLVGEILFAILAVITLGVLALALGSGPFGSTKSEKRTRFISYLVINFSDDHKKTTRKILISGSKRKVERFIDRYQNRLIKLS